MTLADERARQQENTNFDLNRRASLRPYLWEREAGDRLPRPGAQGAIPWAYSAPERTFVALLVISKTALHKPM